MKTQKSSFRTLAADPASITRKATETSALSSTTQDLAEAGWNVRILKPRDDDEVPNHYIPVAISFRSFPSIPPADVCLISGGNMTHLTEDTINVLDGAEAINIDLTIRPRYFTDDKTGEERIKAYLHDMYVTVAKNRLAEKYADMEHPEDY